MAEQWAMIGLVTGSEIFGLLPQVATGRVATYFNREITDVLVVNRVSGEDLGEGETDEVGVPLHHITYIQPWGIVDGPLQTAVGEIRRTSMRQIGVVLRTRITITGMGEIEPGIDLAGLPGLLDRANDQFIAFGACVISTPGGESREAQSLLVNKTQVMLAQMEPPPVR